MGLTFGEAQLCVRNKLFDVWEDYITNGYNRTDQCGDEQIVAPPEFKVLGEPNRPIYVPQLTEERAKVKNGDEGKHYAKFYTRQTNSTQENLRGAIDQPGVRYRNRGLVFVDLYFSKSAYKDSDESFLVELIQWVYRDAPVTDSDVWFSNTTPTRRTGPLQFYVTSITSNYQFDEFKI